MEQLADEWDVRQPHIMVAMLEVTHPYYKKLPNRDKFYRATRQALLKRHDEITTNSILRGLMSEKTEEIKKLPPARGSVAEEIEEYRANARKLLSQSRIQFEIEHREQEIVRHQSMIEFLKSIGARDYDT